MSNAVLQSGSRSCRRTILKAFCGAVGGLTLADLLHARAASNEHQSTSVIFVTLGGGPAQHETYDPKPDAPAEYRGDFKDIATKVVGLRFSELLPRQAAI